MKVKLLGAAQTVTGSCYIIETENSRFAIDCGMHQGSEGFEKRNFNAVEYNAKDLDFVLLTHAHIDHSGLLPKLVKDGFSGSVYCTKPTKALLGLMLLDSAHIQEMEADWATRKNIRQGGKPVEPLYTSADAELSTKLLKEVEYNNSFNPSADVRISYKDAGHIIGSAFLEVEVTEASGVTRLIFSGDLGRAGSLLMEDPSFPKIEADYLFLESTYGDRNHKNADSSLQELADVIAKSVKAGEKTIMPAFAVERTQELIYCLYLLQKQGKLSPDLPIYVDSPLAVRATKVFREYPEYLDKSFAHLAANGGSPFDMPNLRYLLDAKDSQALNESQGPGIIISSSGMCNAGRIKHHLRHHLWREGAQIVFTGYQAVGTPGRKLVDGAKQIKILGDLIEVRAEVSTIGGFSGHAGQSQLLDWVSNFVHPKLHVILVHGEEKAQTKLAELLTERFAVRLTVPNYMDQLSLTPGLESSKVQALEVIHPDLQPSINWNILILDTESKIAMLRKNLEQIGKKPWPEQVDMRQQLLTLNRDLLHLLSQV